MEVMLPDNAPKEYKDPATLWNAVERSEKAKNAQTAREVEVSLPTELSPTDQIILVRDYVKNNFISRGMCADIAIHDKKDGNPHAHIMLTMRSIGEDGNFLAKSKKIYELDADGNRQYDPVKHQYKCRKETVNDWDRKENVELWRANWAAACNREFERVGIPERLDHRSYERQGKEQLPTMHLGPIEHRLNQRGIKGERTRYNDEVRQVNQEYAAAKGELKKDFDEYEREREETAKKKSFIEQTVRAINGLKLDYINLEYAKMVEARDNQQRYDKRKSLEGQIDDLNRRQEYINSHDVNIGSLHARRERLGIFHGKAKKQIDKDIMDLQESKRQAVSSLYSKYQIKPGQIDSYIETLNSRLCNMYPKSIMEELEEKKNNLQPSIKERQAAIKERYDEIMKTLETLPEYANIKSILDRTKFVSSDKDKELFQAAVHNSIIQFLTYTPQRQSRHQTSHQSRTMSYDMGR